MKLFTRVNLSRTRSYTAVKSRGEGLMLIELPNNATSMESVMESACEQKDSDHASVFLVGQLLTIVGDDVTSISSCVEEMEPEQLDWSDQEENPAASEELPRNKRAVSGVILKMFIEFKSEDTEALNGNVSDLGLPNIGYTCYMNSCLQGLLTLQDFFKDLSDAEGLLETVPAAQVMSVLAAIKDAHSSTDVLRKICLLSSFKETISVLSPEFKSYEPKDAHEFLTAVLHQTWDLTTGLKKASKEQNYCCPVENNMLFHLEKIRTCVGCGVKSIILEESLNLSLDLVPGATMKTMLEGYLKETEVEYNCSCGAKASSQGSAIDVPPKVLILHLKRFSWTPSCSLLKRRDSVEVSRELEVPSNHGPAHYQLVSAVSHLGPSVNFGHYVCDRVHPDHGPDQTSDRWLTLSDVRSEETTGESVCQRRRTSAYILFYLKQNQDQVQSV